MVVMKFGGTSIAEAQPIARVASIVACEAGDRVVVAIPASKTMGSPALAGVTDRLPDDTTMAGAPS